jgi:cytoskeletal protein RodZ
MSPTLVMYIGFVVAIFILIWGVRELSRRWYGRRSINPQAMNTWVHLKPTSTDRDAIENLSASTEDGAEDSQQDGRSRAQQNGHYSESKKTL